MSNLKQIFCLSTLFIASMATADPKSMLYERYLEKSTAQKSLIHEAEKPNIEEYTFRQFLNHADPAHGTFKQRYYIDETFGKDNDAPVFFYICGESVCRPNALMGAIRTHAKQFGAKLIALEHRFYGHSIPHDSLSTANLSFLSTDYALKDLANFQKWIIKKRGWHGKWVAFGGSYPGSLSAYYRETYPNLVVGSLASSAPVEAKEDFQEYDQHVTKIAGPTCAKLMQEVVHTVESQLADPEALAKTKSLFQAEHISDNRDFLYLIADVGAVAVQYGMKDKFCSALQEAQTPVEGYADFAKFIYRTWDVAPEQFVAQGAMSTDPNDYPDGLGMRQWFYQSCREYGYWQNAASDPLHSTRSHLIDLNYHHEVCKRLFDIDTPANTQHINQHYFYPLQSPKTSHIFFTNGSTDPWMNLSLAVENGNTSNPNLSYFTIHDAAHCDDLRTPNMNDSSALKSAREQVQHLVKEWIK